MIPLHAEIHAHPETGKLHARIPAGGSGGGVTSYVDMPVSDAEHVALLDAEAERKAAEAEMAQQKADEARAALEDADAPKGPVYEADHREEAGDLQGLDPKEEEVREHQMTPAEQLGLPEPA